MKKICTLALVSAISFNCLAQTQKIVLEKKQQLKFVTTLTGSTSIDAITQSMDINTNINSSKNIIVNDVTKDKYDIDLTTTKLKLDISIIGDSKKFDSEDKSDTTGEFKDLAKNVDVPQKIFLYKNGMSVAADTAKKAEFLANDNNPLTGLLGKAMAEGINEPVIVESFFMLIPDGKKLGDSWEDSTINTDSKTYSTYTWDSTKANIATIKVVGKVNNKINTEMAEMHMTLDATMNNTISEIRRVNIKTGVVIFRNIKTVIDGSAELMNMNLPITGTTEATTILEEQ